MFVRVCGACVVSVCHVCRTVAIGCGVDESPAPSPLLNSRTVSTSSVGFSVSVLLPTCYDVCLLGGDGERECVDVP